MTAPPDSRAPKLARAHRPNLRSVAQGGPRPVAEIVTEECTGGTERRWRKPRLALLAGALAYVSHATPALAQKADQAPIPKLGKPQPSLPARPLGRIRVRAYGAWPFRGKIPLLKRGERYNEARLRQAIRALYQRGDVAEVKVSATQRGGRIDLLFQIGTQRLVSQIQIQSDADISGLLAKYQVREGQPLLPNGPTKLKQDLKQELRSRGYHQAQVTVATRRTDDPTASVLLVEIRKGPPRAIDHVRVIVASQRLTERLKHYAKSYGANAGARADRRTFAKADKQLQSDLEQQGFLHARVEHRLTRTRAGLTLEVRMTPGPLRVVQFAGNLHIDKDELLGALGLERDANPADSQMLKRLRLVYKQRGFFDVGIRVKRVFRRKAGREHWLFDIREGKRLQVSNRSYPCLTGSRSPKELGREIDSFLEEELPGATLLSPVDPQLVDAQLAPRNRAGARPAPLSLDPRRIYAPNTYNRALKHLQNLYRAEGYLYATVGPLQAVRYRCAKNSPPGRCIPLRPRQPLVARCLIDADHVPIEEPPIAPEYRCVPNPKKGISCAPQVALRIPVHLGPRSQLYDLAFDGARRFSPPKLLEASGLKVGDPASNVGLEEARRALLNHYRNAGYAYADVRAKIELSPNKRRARARFTIFERQRVVIEGIRIVGNRQTDASVIRSRLRFREGDYFKQDVVRRSEELVATLGVFSTVSIELQDEAIPATRKVVIVRVEERPAQYLEVRPGIATGEGVRGILEYGHRNLGGKAISFRLRVRLSYLPDFLIPDARVLENFNKLPLGQRLARRNTIGVQFPNVFDPNIRAGFDLIDVRNNARDFGLTKDALQPVLSWRPARQFTGTLGASLEVNDVNIFSGDTVESYLQQPGITNDLNRLLRVPDGRTIAVAQRVFAAWDRRDNPLGATRGTLLAGSVEHVRAFPSDSNDNTITSNFMRYSGRVAGYVRLSEGGMALAGSLRGGIIQQLINGSKTYPDRLFFLGGIDTVRGFTRDSLVPQDIADKIQADIRNPPLDRAPFTIDQVAIRGGDVFINPRLELRIPLAGPLHTTLFTDGGNLWVDPAEFAPLSLRYTAGSGIRVATPIGPVALDYGINLMRRSWEDFGAIHFSIGLF